MRDVHDDGGDTGGGVGLGGADKCRARDAAEHAESTYDRRGRGGQVSVIAATACAPVPRAIALPAPPPRITPHLEEKLHSKMV